jgi:hypothetical protein
LSATISPKLLISSPSPVTENANFQVIITANEAPIEDVEVTFDGNINSTDSEGKTSFTAPFVEADNDYLIKAEKVGYIHTTAIITIEDRQLVISASSTVVEGDPFTVTVRREDTGEAVIGTDVTFNGETNQTNANGQVNFTAPEVDQETDYTISAKIDGYQSDTALIKVLNKGETLSQGWIYGIVFDNNGSLQDDALVCAKILEGTTSTCTFTDEDGKYVRSLPVGTYTIVATKESYEESFKSITVNENKAIEVNFVLEKSENGYVSDDNRKLIDEAIRNGTMGGEIIIKEGGEIEEFSYSNFTITSTSLDAENKKIELIVEGQGTGTTIAVTVEDESILKIRGEEIIIEYDGKKIRSANSLQEVLNASENSGPTYYILDNIIVIGSQHFSEHTITIYQVIEFLTGPIAIAIYAAISVIALILFVLPAFKGPYPPIYYRRKKR